MIPFMRVTISLVGRRWWGRRGGATTDCTGGRAQPHRARPRSAGINSAGESLCGAGSGGSGSRTGYDGRAPGRGRGRELPAGEGRNCDRPPRNQENRRQIPRKAAHLRSAREDVCSARASPRPRRRPGNRKATVPRASPRRAAWCVARRSPASAAGATVAQTTISIEILTERRRSHLSSDHGDSTDHLRKNGRPDRPALSTASFGIPEILHQFHRTRTCRTTTEGHLLSLRTKRENGWDPSEDS